MYHISRSVECNFPCIESNQNCRRCERFWFSCQNACQVFGVETLFPEQFKALKTFVSSTDILLNLPAGFRKSLMFQMAPLVHAKLSRGRNGCAANPIVIITSPLVSLMKHQNVVYRKCGISAGSMWEDKVFDMKIEKGECWEMVGGKAFCLLTFTRRI